MAWRVHLLSILHQLHVVLLRRLTDLPDLVAGIDLDGLLPIFCLVPSGILEDLRVAFLTLGIHLVLLLSSLSFLLCEVKRLAHLARLLLVLLVCAMRLLDTAGSLLLADCSFLQNDIVKHVEVFQILRRVLLSLDQVLLLIVLQIHRVLRRLHVDSNAWLILPILVCLAS